MDNAYKVTSRQVYTLSMAFSSTGGFMSLVSLIIMALVHKFQKIEYYAHIIKSLYRYYPDDSSQAP